MDVVTSTIAILVVSLAAFLDVRTRRIPNWLTLGLVIIGVALNLWRAGLMGAELALAGTVLGFLMLLPFYALGGIGAGDVKLLAAVGALLGPELLVSVAAYGALVGGLMSVVILARRSKWLPQNGATGPYGVAIASGVFLATWLPHVIG